MFFSVTEDQDQKFCLPACAIPRYGGNNAEHIIPNCDLPVGAFQFDKKYFVGLEHITSTASAVATTMMKSKKWMNVFVNCIMKIHHTESSCVLNFGDASTVLPRLRSLISEGFFVTVDPHNTFVHNVRAEPLGFILRGGHKRFIYLDESFVSHLKTHSLESTNTSSEEEKMHAAIMIIALLCAHEASHWLHSMVNPAFFFKDSTGAMKVENNISPFAKMTLSTFPGVYLNDFGRMVETAYYGGSVCILEMLDDFSGLAAMYAIEFAQIRIPQDKKGRPAAGVEVRVAVPHESFKMATYDAGGLVFPEVESRLIELAAAAAAIGALRPALKRQPSQALPRLPKRARNAGEDAEADEAGTSSSCTTTQRRSGDYDIHDEDSDFTNGDDNVFHPAEHSWTLPERVCFSEVRGGSVALRANGSVSGDLGWMTA